MENNILEFLGAMTVGYAISRLIHNESRKECLDKINILEKKIEKLEDFRFSFYEKNLLLGDKREWDEISSDQLDEEDI